MSIGFPPMRASTPVPVGPDSKVEFEKEKKNVTLPRGC